MTSCNLITPKTWPPKARGRVGFQHTNFEGDTFSPQQALRSERRQESWMCSNEVRKVDRAILGRVLHCLKKSEL